MPLYEYLCKTCGHSFEVLQKFSDPSLFDCLQCGEKSERILSAPSIRFKGSGWYITDYSKKPASSESSQSKSSGSESPPKAKSTPTTAKTAVAE